MTLPLTSGGISPGGAGSSDPFAGLPPSRGGTGQGISQPSAAADHELGQRLAGWIGLRGGQNFALAPILSQVQDLLGADTSLLVPLRDLLQRPAFRSLFSGEGHSVQLGRRDALLADLAGTYTAALLSRLALVIDGCLGLPADPSSLPPLATTASAAPPRRAEAAWAAPSPPAPVSTPAWMADPPAAAAIPTYGNPTGQPPSQGYGRSAAAGAAFAPAASGAALPTGGHPAARRGSSLTTTLIVLLSLLVGGAVGLAAILLLNRSPAPSTSSTPPIRSAAPATPGAAPPAPTPAPPPKQPAAPEPGTPAPAGAWGGPEEYKFGRLPQGDYPDSCAFTRTDPAGQRTIDKSQLEYWACRDIGGDADRGYSVVWADGKQTTYTFRDDGSGAVVGTNGSSYAMSWRNDSHQGSNIIVISHQDGATTWIPGHVK